MTYSPYVAKIRRRERVINAALITVIVVLLVVFVATIQFP